MERQPQLLRLDGVRADVAGRAVYFTDARRRGERDLVYAVLTVDDEGALAAEPQQRLAHQRQQARMGDAEHLIARAGRVGERPQDVEDGTDADLAARGADVTHGGVVGGSKHEAEADALDAGRDVLRPQLQLNAERLQHVRAAALAGGGAIAMLGDGLAERGGDEAGGGGDVEGAGGVTAGATGIYRVDVGGERDVDRLLPHDAGKTRHLIHRLAFQAQRREEGAKLRGRGLA